MRAGVKGPPDQRERPGRRRERTRTFPSPGAMGSGHSRPRNSAQASGGCGIGDLPPVSLRLEVSERKGLVGWTSRRTWFETIFCWQVFAGSDVCLGAEAGGAILSFCKHFRHIYLKWLWVG